MRFLHSGYRGLSTGNSATRFAPRCVLVASVAGGLWLASAVSGLPRNGDPELRAGETPALAKLHEARQQVEARADTFTYGQLASALLERGRETGDRSHLVAARRAIDRSLDLEPRNLVALRLDIRQLLLTGDVPAALHKAQKLNETVPDDLLTYGLLAEALARRGRYDEATAAMQWMLDLRPPASRALECGAELRWLLGDRSGADGWMRQALDFAMPYDLGRRAYLLSRLARFELWQGQLEGAARDASEALELVTENAEGLAVLADVRLLEGQFDEAVSLLETLHRNAGTPESVLALADALNRSGERQRAASLYREFATRAWAVSETPQNVNNELVARLLADGDATTALAVAERSLEWQRDWETLLAWARALAENGRLDESWATLEEAMAPGILSAELDYYAGRIALERRDAEAARHYLSRSLELNPRSAVAAEARRLLADGASESELRGE